ncbi:MAG: hypothetical protein V1859_06385 [archaeon]
MNPIAFLPFLESSLTNNGTSSPLTSIDLKLSKPNAPTAISACFFNAEFLGRTVNTIRAALSTHL